MKDKNKGPSLVPKKVPNGGDAMFVDLAAPMSGYSAAVCLGSLVPCLGTSGGNSDGTMSVVDLTLPLVESFGECS